MTPTSWRRILPMLAALLALVGGAIALADPLRELLDGRPAGAVGTVVVPDRFVRPWDPVTVFYPSEVGPGEGVPEDEPTRFVRLNPDHPGAYTWLDSRTLQFKPAEPWPPLSRFNWRVAGDDVVLTTLVAPPRRSIPADGAEDLDPVESITLTFASPMDPKVLARMVSIELRTLPGVGSAPIQVLTASDFTVKAMERQSAGGEATYVLRLDNPIPLGVRATLRMRLALDDDAEEAVAQLDFSTAQPFRARTLGCPGARYPVTPEGTVYTRDQALGCGAGTPAVVIEFSAEPSGLGPVEGRNLVRFEPAVSDLSFELSGRRLEVRGRFERETLYEVTLSPTPIQDRAGRALEIEGKSSAWMYFPRRERYLRWTAGQGIAERRGPKRVPLEGRGHTRVDVRVYSVDPLDRSFWPFPNDPISVDESERPPGPGEEPKAHDAPDRAINRGELTAHLRTLGAPPVSELMDLPLREDGAAARFGLDLSEQLEYLSGQDAPGHYLIGLRPLDGGSVRSWVRLQVTDLALSAVEEPDRVRFLVTSLSTGRPVAGARVTVEGTVRKDATYSSTWSTLVTGVTDIQGAFTWQAPGYDASTRVTVQRVHAAKEGDVLVIDANQAPDTYRNNHWDRTRGSWLSWAFQRLESRGEQPTRMAHVFTERPVYRPEEEVYITGFIRDHHKGALTWPSGEEGFLVVEGPGDTEWRYPVTLSETGSFTHVFKEEDLPTGLYRTWFESKGGSRYGQITFKVEAYRIPRFEVELHGDDDVPMDREFQVAMTAEYYAGGHVAGQPVRWRVTQYPYTWTPPAQEGFLFSSDGRYSRSGRFDAAAALEKDDVTDDSGAATIVLDPSVEPTAQPRTYVVEATVTGADDQTVTSTKRVHALPAFVVGLKVPRYIEQATEIAPEIIAVGHDGALVEGQPLTLRLKKRQWHSHLQAGDFSEGSARYVTDVVDELVSETSISSGSAPLTVSLPVDGAGVYIVEVEGQDRLGRGQLVSVDLYAGGDEAVSWEKPTTPVFDLSTDKESYDPGDTATVLIRSPFRNGQALVIIETPTGNDYRWEAVRGGKASVRVPIRKAYMPKLPVHVVLMRGRVPDTEDGPGTQDLGKPATMAATEWLTVNPVEHQVQVTLDHAPRALPGQELPVTVRLMDHKDRPIAGEVTLWLVDAAVLALGTEQRLDPLPDFIGSVRSYLGVLDTRNLTFGGLPFAEMPGGDGDGDDGDPLDRATIRKNFKSVPYYKHGIPVGRDGVARVVVPLPDNLTNFKVRVKATAGPERFGFGKSEVAVRLPLIVQPALPRFVRPGDQFDAVAIGRVVEGDGGAGKAQMKAEGVSLQGEALQQVDWATNRPERLAFPVKVDDPGYTDDGTLARDAVRFTVGVSRAADGASDAFQVDLPLKPDRAPVVERLLQELAKGQSVELPALGGDARPGTFKRSVLVSDQPALVRMAAGMDFLIEQPYGCTEQRMSKARAMIALTEFRRLLGEAEQREQLDAAVADVLAWLPQVVDDRGLVSYWPGSRGYVSLTAWTVMFLVEAEDAGYRVDPSLTATMSRALQQSLRSDYRYFISGESYAERAWALKALAATGDYQAAYFAELSRQAQWTNAEGVTQIVQAGVLGGQTDASVMNRLVATLADGVITRLYQGAEIYAGLTPGRSRSGLILPSEARLLAQMTRAIAQVDPKNAKLPVMVQALINLGKEDGWGNTNANAEALLALSERLKAGDLNSTPHAVRYTEGGQAETLKLGPEGPIVQRVSLAGQGGAVTLSEGEGPLIVRVETSYVPKADGGAVAPDNQGFVVTRRLLRVVDGPMEKIPLDDGGKTVSFAVGEVVEDHVQVVNPADRHHVAVVVPLAAGMEPLNPALATAPPEARPENALTLAPSYAAYYDDAVSFYYDSLPKGTYDFYFRTRATTPGRFSQPAAQAQMMYDLAVRGNSAGARVEVVKD
ncbi:MAG: alpha-2-macroglobulin [Alphaproteobacteria bacterium]|nr:alpha-2-macroglobulin [Alphaproteobacteria bacterium]